MLQDIYNDIQAKIQQQIQEKFGLSADQIYQRRRVWETFEILFRRFDGGRHERLEGSDE